MISEPPLLDFYRFLFIVLRRTVTFVTDDRSRYKNTFTFHNAHMASITDDEKKSFTFGGQRARPRKGIEAKPVVGETYLKAPGSCATKWPSLGVAVTVECCNRSNIYVLDRCEQVQISECVGCRIIIGPCPSSVMIFDCVDCTIAVAAKQVRLRDCANCELRTFAPTSDSVVIETSKGLRFGAWDVAYPGLSSQFQACKWLGVRAKLSAAFIKPG